MDKLSVGQKLLLLRRKKNISQRALAKALGVNFTSILRYEKDVTIPSTDVLIKLANFFNISIDYLILDKNGVLSFNDAQLFSQFKELDGMEESKRNIIKPMIQSFINQ